MSHKESFWRYWFARFIGSFAGVCGFFLALLLFILFVGFIGKMASPSMEGYLPIQVRNARTNYDEALAKHSDIILQIDIEDVIGKSGNPLGSGKMVSKFLQQPKLYGISNDRIKGIMVNINSPGGSVTDSDMIYQSIMDLKKELNIPAHAWTHNLCASGGYYIACSTDYISSDTINIIGSVGVISGPKFNLYQAMKDHGISQTTLSAGKNKQHFPMFAPMPLDQSSYKDFIVIINTFYNRFLNIVCNARSSKGLTREKLIELGATVYMSDKAVELGYIDKANVRYEQAMEFLLKEAGTGDKHVQVINYYSKPSFVESLKSKIESKLSFFFGDDTDKAPCRYEMK